MQFPAIIIHADGTRSLFHSPAGFASERTITIQRPVVSDDPDAPAEMAEVEETQLITHPPEAWVYWTPDDWAAMCPDLIVRSVIDPGPPSVDGRRAVRLPVEAWEIGDNAATVTYALVDLTSEESVARTTAARRSKVLAIPS